MEGNKIKIIDIFSGPGGLSEGFASFKNNTGINPFKIAVSIEKDVSAHKTLKLRSFYRKFNNKAPEEYYEFLKGNFGKTPDELLYKQSHLSEELKEAENETLCLELGKDNIDINKRILDSLGQDECILIGGPPCQAYSLAGRSRNKGNENYSAESDGRNFLYKEYLKVIAEFQPLIFVMENVKGMLSARVGGKSIYDAIYKDLQDPCNATELKPKRTLAPHKYKIHSLVTPVHESILAPKDYVIKSELYGVPQKRHRVILLGIREDISQAWRDDFILNTSKTLPIKNVLSDLPKLRSGLSKELNNHNNWIKQIKHDSKSTIKALKNYNRIDIADELKDSVNNMEIFGNEQGSNFGQIREVGINNTKLANWFYDKRLNNYICNHETKNHMTSDLQRYLFCSIWAKVGEKNRWQSLSPKSNNFPKELYPNHKNFDSGKWADRFRVQPWSLPATTVTCHISKDGHYYIHPDPLQCRSLTVREAARIQTFPDNYFFVGTKTKQYEQVGNAVPPYLAWQIANIIEKVLDNI